MKRQEFLDRHWRFYLMLENRFINALQYVELDKDNFKTFSMEFVSQIREIGSEIDVVLKELLDHKQNARKNISDYIDGLERKCPEIFEEKIIVRGIEIFPFNDLDKQKPSELFWWKAYNDVKHGRVLNYKAANLENVLTMLATLYLFEMYLFKKSIDKDEADVVEKDTELFRIEGWKTRYVSMSRTLIEFRDEEKSINFVTN